MEKEDLKLTSLSDQGLTQRFEHKLITMEKMEQILENRSRINEVIKLAKLAAETNLIARTINFPKFETCEVVLNIQPLKRKEH